MLRIRTYIVMILAILLMSAGIASAAEGEMGCVVRIDRTTNPRTLERTIGKFLLKNYLFEQSIDISVDVFDEDGNELCYWTDPPFSKDPIEPHGVTSFSTDDLAKECPDLPEVGWINVEIYWQSPQPVEDPLYGLHGHITLVKENIRTGVTEISASRKCDTFRLCPSCVPEP